MRARNSFPAQVLMLIVPTDTLFPLTSSGSNVVEGEPSPAPLPAPAAPSGVGSTTTVRQDAGMATSGRAQCTPSTSNN
jgi:hypothetical protein